MIHSFRVLHPFCGIGGAAIGTERARAYFNDHEARFVNVGGIDIDELACQDFETLTGVRALRADMHDLTPAELLAYCPERPDLVMSSPPCFSALLSAKKAKEPKYERMNQLMVDTIFLLLSTWDEPPPVLFFENVPRILSRGKDVVAEVVKQGHAHGYAVDIGNHDCGEVGGLAQHRDRCFILMRRRDVCPQEIYKPRKLRVRACGEVLGPLPLPGDVEAGGPMHSLPRLSWKNACRLAAIPAGGDWRDLPNIVAEGKQRREEFRRHAVVAWDEAAETVVGAGGAAADNVADPRVGDEQLAWFNNSHRVTGFDEPARTVTGGPIANAVVADPRIPFEGETTPVQSWDDPSRTVTGNSRVRGSGAGAVADPRWTGGGKMGVTPWQEPASTVTGEGSITGARAAVADPRFGNVDRVAGWDEAIGTITGTGRAPSSGGAAVADPRFADGKKKNWQQVAGVTPWTEPSSPITGNAKIHAGAFQVADPRIDQVVEAVGGAARHAEALRDLGDGRSMLRVELGRTVRVPEAALEKYIREQSAAPERIAVDVVDLAALVKQVRRARRLLDARCSTSKTRWPGYTYAVRAGATDLVKIGQAIDPAERIRDLQFMSPLPLVLVGLCHVSAIEGDMHREFVERRRHGEWFALVVDPIPDVKPTCFGCVRYRPT